MEIIDCQIHNSDRLPPDGKPYPGRLGSYQGYFTNEEAIVAMDAVGVDAAILVARNGFRGSLPDGTNLYDYSYAEEAVQRHPGRFGVLAQVEYRAPNIEEVVAGLRSRPGTLALKVVVGRGRPGEGIEELQAGRYARLFHAAAKHDVPVVLYAVGHLQSVEWVARAHPDLRLIVDHLGLPMHPMMTPDPDPWQQLPQLLSYATFPNVAVRMSRAPTLSKAPYPFTDMWPALHRLIDAFGAERLMWGSDITTCRPMHTYAEAVHCMRDTTEISEDEKTKIMGSSLRTWMRWPKEKSV